MYIYILFNHEIRPFNFFYKLLKFYVRYTHQQQDFKILNSEYVLHLIALPQELQNHESGDDRLHLTWDKGKNTSRIVVVLILVLLNLCNACLYYLGL